MQRRSDAPERLEVEVELTEKDTILAHFWTVLQMPLVRLLVGINALFLLVAALLVVRAVSRGEGLPPALLAAAAAIGAAFILAPLQIRRRAVSHYRDLSESQRRGRYAFTGEGFEWTLGRSPGRAPWAAVARSQETGRHVFLMTRSFRTHVLPKTGLDEEALARLRSMFP